MNGLTSDVLRDGFRQDGSYREGLRVVAVANTPRLIREALERALDGVPGLLVVDLGGDPERAEELARQIQVNWLVVTLEPGAAMSRRVRRLLHRVPSLSILGLSAEGDRVEIVVDRGGQLRRYTYWGVRLSSLIGILRGAEKAEERLYPSFAQRNPAQSESAMADRTDGSS
jgi:hypothetical protein